MHDDRDDCDFPAYDDLFTNRLTRLLYIHGIESSRTPWRFLNWLIRGSLHNAYCQIRSKLPTKLREESKKNWLWTDYLVLFTIDYSILHSF